MVFHKTLVRGLGFLIVLAGCGTSTGLTLVTDGDVFLSGLSDEFDDPGSISMWLVRAEVEGDPSDGSVSINGGQLLLRPSQDRYFLNDHRGLSLFKNIASAVNPSFRIEAHITVLDPVSGGAPTETFHSAGLVIYPDVTRMSNWVVTNIGLQDGVLGFEDKTTVNDNSVLTLYPTGQEFSGSVRLCVVDDVITVFTRLDADPAWTERNSFTHAIGTTLGAGVMINDYLAGTAEVEGQFDYVRFQDIDSVDDCR
jgi:hypothetical protein